MKNWLRVLKPGGELHIWVPSLEWVAREILAEEPSVLMLVHIFGPQADESGFWLSGFTMRRLRVDFDDLDLQVVTARTAYYSMVVGGQDVKAEQHYVVGRKPDVEEVS